MAERRDSTFNACILSAKVKVSLFCRGVRLMSSLEAIRKEEVAQCYFAASGCDAFSQYIMIARTRKPSSSRG